MCQAAYHFGMAFQISDDLLDLDQDKTHPVNLALHLGKEKALNRIQKEIEALKGSLRSLNLETCEMIAITQKLEDYASTAAV